MVILFARPFPRQLQRLKLLIWPNTKAPSGDDGASRVRGGAGGFAVNGAAELHSWV